MTDLLTPRFLASQPHEVLAASVVDGAREIARLNSRIDEVILLASLDKEQATLTIQHVQGKLAAAEADTKRLDWLEALTANGKGPVRLDHAKGPHESLRAAIDAAREATK